LIWTVMSDDAARVLALDDAAFLAALQDRFGFRTGRFVRVGRRQAWPLALTAAQALTAPRVVLIGNAAQTIHPLGAQGFNLGLRDVMALAQRLHAGVDPGDPAVLADYVAAREPDRAATMDFSDGLTRLFARGDALTRASRGAGLAAISRLKPVKHELAFALMGWRSGAAA
jgi:2-octaprenyl-6-methoxyphenol hydroxylase